MKVQMMAAVMLFAASLGGCIWIDDDDGVYIPGGELEETVIYINRTAHTIDNTIDDAYVGSIGPGGSLEVVSLTLDGPHVYFSTCRGCDLTWGPTTFSLREGEVFRIYLEETGMRGSSASR